MRRSLRRVTIGVAVVAVLALSAFLISYAQWVRSIDSGSAALAKGDLASAERVLSSAGQRVAWTPGYRELVFNRARLLYAAQRDDELTRMLESEAARAPFIGEASEYHFWLGNVQFRRAAAQKDKQAVQSGLQQAAESYRRSLAAAPEDWDAKYNYELTVRLLEGMRKGKDDDLQKMKRGQMKILREETDKSKEQQRQVAPEKRG